MMQLRGWLAYCTGHLIRTQTHKACSRMYISCLSKTSHWVC